MIRGIALLREGIEFLLGQRWLVNRPQVLRGLHRQIPVLLRRGTRCRVQLLADEVLVCSKRRGCCPTNGARAGRDWRLRWLHWQAAALICGTRSEVGRASRRHTRRHRWLIALVRIPSAGCRYHAGVVEATWRWRCTDPFGRLWSLPRSHHTTTRRGWCLAREWHRRWSVPLVGARGLRLCPWRRKWLEW